VEAAVLPAEPVGGAEAVHRVVDGSRGNMAKQQITLPNVTRLAPGPTLMIRKAQPRMKIFGLGLIASTPICGTTKSTMLIPAQSTTPQLILI